MVSKAELRRMARARLLTLTEAELAEKSASLCNHLNAHPAWEQASTVCLFAPLAREPDVELLWDPLFRAGRRFCYPRLNGVHLDLYEVTDPALLATSQWQLREPLHHEDHFIAPDRVDLILVPGLGFTRTHERLGRGGGVFDRFLPGLRAVKAGICFDLQLLDQLPIEPHDVGVDHVFTESGCLPDA